MKLRSSVGVLAAMALTACAPQVPDSARGVGFDTVQSSQARDAALEGSNVRVPVTVLPPAGGTGASPPVSGTTPVPGSAEATAQQTTIILAQTRPAGAQPPAVASTLPVTAVPDNTTGISQENNFDVVAGQRSIEGDAQRIEQNRAQYQVVEPQALPQRDGASQPNIVAFALSTNHPVGTQVYARAGLNGAARAERNCRAYPSPDQAQIDFLARGGPLRDRKGLDPDGDGYACSWNPAPFRKASQG
ncbi:MAG: hypothetical protein V2I76_12450 [Roseobacter sp.]|jgi:hypothetical protein|nr:hypothetical protein [Roseobacter sp.]